ncbi:MAG: topoisomerase C-terminal repeat-containing protein, partial [Pseudomonadota bacterium]
PIGIYDGKYGHYVKWEKVNATLPEGTRPEDLTLDDALALIAEKAPKKKAVAKAGGKTAKAKTTAKKPATKTAAKKPAARKKTPKASAAE